MTVVFVGSVDVRYGIFVDGRQIGRNLIRDIVYNITLV